jgi:hypothetical protein
VAALRLANTVREDVREALKLALRFYEQAIEDRERADQHFQRAAELLGSQRCAIWQIPVGLLAH